MASDKNAKWKNIKTKKIITGSWTYNWSGNYFFISLDKREPISGMPIEFKIYDEHPEWGNWKLIRNEHTTKTKTKKSSKNS